MMLTMLRMFDGLRIYRLQEDVMAQELTGLEYLRKKEIKNMKCDMNKHFAFISYSHDDYDSQIVMNVFKQLMNKGYNLWIDTANMPTDENTWKKSARDALRNKNCKIAFFFRSESSMIKDTIANELKTIIKLKHIKQIVTVDIWQKEGMDADTYYEDILNDGSDAQIDVCDKICELVDTECKAIRLAGDAGNDILSLVEEMEEELKAIEGITSDSDDEDGSIEDDIDEGEIDDETDSGNKDDSHGENAINELPYPPLTVNENTTLKEFEIICEKTNICALMKDIRRELGAQPFDYLMASLLRGCDEKIQDMKKGKPIGKPIRRAAYNYCYYAISESTSNQYTWQSNARKWVDEKERLPKYFGKDGVFKGSGQLYDYSEIFRSLGDKKTIGDILNKYRNGEKGFITRDNKKIFEVWEKIKGLNSKLKNQDMGDLL